MNSRLSRAREHLSRSTVSTSAFGREGSKAQQRGKDRRLTARPSEVSLAGENSSSKKTIYVRPAAASPVKAAENPVDPEEHLDVIIHETVWNPVFGDEAELRTGPVVEPTRSPFSREQSNLGDIMDHRLVLDLGTPASPTSTDPFLASPASPATLSLDTLRED
jgi:hypothetical protein